MKINLLFYTQLLFASLLCQSNAAAMASSSPIFGAVVFADTTTIVNVEVCAEDLPYSFNNQVLTEPGTYQDTLPGYLGGDSIIVLHFLVKCCDAPGDTPNFADICEKAPVLCASYINATAFDLSNSNAEMPGNLASQFCYSVDHSRWLRFSACAPNVILELSVDNCQGSNPAQEGVEMALFNSDDCLNFMRIGNCSQTQMAQKDTLMFDGLIPGQVYYLFADGIGLEACTFHLQVLNGINTGIPDSIASSGTITDGMITGKKDVCPGETVIYTLIPPTCKVTYPVFNCSPPAGACGFCGSVSVLDSVIYKWHIPDCGRFLGDSTGLTVAVIYDQCYFDVDTVVTQQIWVETIRVYADTIFVQKDTLVFCDCYGGGLICGNIPPCDVRIHFYVEHYWLEIQCFGPFPEFNGVIYSSPGTYTQYDVSNCKFYIIHVTKEPPPQVSIAPHGIITCIQPVLLHPVVYSPATIIWSGPGQANTYDVLTWTPGFYKVVAIFGNGCISSAATVVLADFNIPAADAGPDQVLCFEENQVHLQSQSLGPNFGFFWSNGGTTSAITVNQAPGTQTYGLTVTNHINGCTATDQVVVKVNPPLISNLAPISLCPGECFSLGNEIFCPMPGDPPAEVAFSSYSGCDSLVRRKFNFHTPDTLALGKIATLNCAVTTVMHQGVTYSQAGAYTVQVDPCTVEQFSIDQDIQSPPPTLLSPVVMCLGECFSFNGQMVCPQTGDPAPQMNLVASNGCDSMVLQPFVIKTPDTLALGKIATLNCAVTMATHQGVTYTQAGSYTVQVDPCTVEQFSIDQDIQLPPPTLLPLVVMCPGECFSFNGQMICPQAGDAAPQMSLVAANGCDSMVLQPFIIKTPDTLALGKIATLNCAVTTVMHQGITYTQAGNYTVQLNPCTVEQFSIDEDIQSPPPKLLSPLAVCPGECFSFNGQMVCPQAGDPAPQMSLVAANGCDSMVLQPFVIKAPDTLSLGKIATLNCAVTMTTHQGVTYTQAGNYTVQLNPCTVEQFSIDQDIQSPPPTLLSPLAVCPGECFSFNGQMVCPQAGDPAPQMSLVAANGCDSMVLQPFVIKAPDTLSLGKIATLNCAVTMTTHQGVTYTQAGNYTVQLNPCTVEQFSIDQDIQSPPPTLLSPLAVCPGECFSFNGQMVCPQAGDPAPQMSLIAANGCDSLIAQPFLIHPPDTLSLGNIGTLDCATTVVSYQGISYQEPGLYTVQIDPCTLERFTVAKNPESCLEVYVPNIIQSNGNDVNGWFTVYTGVNAQITVNYLRIFDRWGEQVFSNTEFAPNVPESGWNGTSHNRKCLPGVYIYVYELKLPNGERQFKTGDVTVLR